MNGSKLFIASIVVLALAIGFFLGSFCGHRCYPQHPGTPPVSIEEKIPASEVPHGEFHGKKDFKHRMDFAAMDSLLQVTPEQKAAIEANRAKGDSIFKELRKQKHEAEKALGEALESRDAAGIDAAKAKVLEADKALLEHRINGMAALGNILTPEQLAKFNAFHKEQMKLFKERMKNGPHRGLHGGHEHGNPPPMPPAN